MKSDAELAAICAGRLHDTPASVISDDPRLHGQACWECRDRENGSGDLAVDDGPYSSMLLIPR